MYTPADVGAEPDDVHERHYGNRQQSWIFYPNNVLAYDMNRPAGTAYYHKPRG